ncbi:dolichol-phosphate mannosyltransferase subunit 3-like [Rhopilema esculentum]|uniref:dolichol-phosphate mannosyltransferase subunit 3-like n=1 Tax=Rhopilema esculentum TaxID=499914 RepID=UPI0031DDCAF1
MTKLQEWVFALTLYAILYFLALKNALPFDVSETTKFAIQLSPIILIGLFGVYSVLVIAYRVATFNDCNDAAEELKQQIKEARKDLTAKGFKFD